MPRGVTRKRFLILKGDEMPLSPQKIEEILKADLKNEAKIALVLKESGLSPDDTAALTAALRVLSSLGDRVSGQLVAELTSLIGLEMPEAEGESVEVEKMEHEGEKKDEESSDELPIMKSDGSIDESKIPEPIRAQVVALWKARRDDSAKLKAVQKELDDRRDKEITRQYLDKAGEFKFLPIAKEDLGATLKEVAVSAPNAYAKVEAVLKSANEVLSKSPAFDEFGSASSGGSAGGDISYAQIEQAALAQPIAKEAGMSKDAAVTHFLTRTAEGRRMYSDYCKSKEKKGA